ncbi:hypothetical protein [Jeotgalibacillus campisalis]|uniref:Uncharacterized protein n=1 Tax=Jeotgalibacillus campisalis TaxID=220754 RepID=A0A0C2RKV3_9BACL|nr:hypothetical protein [Jeotgalibacillus campisalis]KIL50875.1 hypothetical protein KR50_07560 [Jeotgalibacillus campisalis]
MEWVFPVLALIGFLLLYAVTKRNTNNGSLSRKGFIQFIAVFAGTFAAVIGIVYYLA